MKPVRGFLSAVLALAVIIGCGTAAAGESISEAPVTRIVGESRNDSEHTPIIMSAPDNDFRTDLQYSYLMDEDPENVGAYAHGAKQLSRPRGIVCDFSADDIGEAKSYVIQRASSEDFSDAVTVEGLLEKKYQFHNLMLGEHFFWRGGTSLKSIADSPVHEMTVTEIPPRICYVEGGTNIRDIGGYASSLVPDGVIRQGLYYRGANINSITKKGKNRMLNELGVRVEIDLRDKNQCGGPYVKGIQYFALSIPSGTEAKRFEEYSSVYRKVFALIANADEKPVFLHCHAGADRTGIVSFILLTVCGAEYEDIARDYLFTNFTDQGPRVLSSEFNLWWAKLDYFAGDTKAEKAKNWLMLKGVPEDQIEHIREIFVEGYKPAQ